MTEIVTRQHLHLALENFALRLMIRLGTVMVAAAVGAVTMLKLTS